MIDWNETHGNEPDAVCGLIGWCPVPGIHGCWISPRSAPFNWQITRQETRDVLLDWLEETLHFDTEQAAIKHIETTMSEWKRELEALEL